MTVSCPPFSSLSRVGHISSVSCLKTEYSAVLKQLEWFAADKFEIHLQDWLTDISSDCVEPYVSHSIKLRMSEFELSLNRYAYVIQMEISIIYILVIVD